MWLITLILLAVLLYFVIFRRINAGLKKSGRAAQFKVGGNRLLNLKNAKGQDRDERDNRPKKVSLRGGGKWERRFK